MNAGEQFRASDFVTSDRAGVSRSSEKERENIAKSSVFVGFKADRKLLSFQHACCCGKVGFLQRPERASGDNSASGVRAGQLVGGGMPAHIAVTRCIAITTQARVILAQRG